MLLTQIITVAAVHLLAVISPGPDFAIVVRNSLVYSRKIAVYTALGIALGISVHVAYSILGIGLLISQSILLFNIIKYIGAGYLIYIGVKSLRSKPTTDTAPTTEEAPKTEKVITSAGALWSGFLTNVLNPKATLFFLSLFTQVIDPQTPKYIQLVFGLEMMLITFLWFGLVAVAFSHSALKPKIAKFQSKLEKITGAVLIALGVKVALSSHK
jgi:RhtB (resistance to homoserine/threonine) family protein